jgi:carboxypeptidase PM20D1
LAVAAAVLSFAAVLVGRALTMKSRQLQVAPARAVKLDVDRAVERFAGSLRFATVSARKADDLAPFFELHQYLEREFPRLHAELDRSVVSGASLLYEWTGTNPDLDPVLLLGHLDVVPVEPDAHDRWTHPPFAGEVADGFVWGRGALDMKQSVLAQLEAVEWLVGQGFRPERTVLLAYGEDEEIGGREGAIVIARQLAERGVRLEMVLDEGAAVVQDIVPGVKSPVALVGIAEKGYASVRVVAREDGGHSSMPPAHTAAGIVATAVHRLERSPLTPRLSRPVQLQFDYLGPEMPFGQRLAVANRWLFGGVLLDRLTAGERTGALVRTTTAVTMLEGSVAANVLPTQAAAVVNFRILPGETVESVLAHVRSVVRDPRTSVELVDGANDPSVVSSIDAPAFAALLRSVREVFPDAVVAPSLVVGMTDSRHYGRLSDRIYRFLPMRLGRDDLERIHGTDERISVDNYVESVRFYLQVIQNVGGAP